jgi:hypothetical protein
MRKISAYCFVALLCVAILSFGVVRPVSAASAGSNPLTLPLVQPTNLSLTFLGSFRVPPGSGNAVFTYGGEAMSVNGSTMYITGMYYYNNGANDAAAIGAVGIPSLSGAPAYDGSNGAATIITSPVIPVNSGGQPDLNCGQAASNTYCVLQGSLVYDGKLYITVAPFYDTTNGANGFILGANPNLSDWGAVNSASAPCLSGQSVRCTQRYFAGALGVVPSIWQPYLGGPCYEANGPFLAIQSNAINGFGFSTFDCAAYNPTGGSIAVNESLDYYYAGIISREPSVYGLNYRSFSGPFPLSGSGCPATLTAAPNDGATSVVLSGGFSGCDGIDSDGPYQIAFSDGETRVVHLTPGNVDVPDGLYHCNYGVTGCSSFPALMKCPSGGCAATVSISPMGDNFFSEYDGPLGYAFIVPGSRSLLYISVHQFGPSAARGSGCDKNASGSNDTTLSVGTGYYRRLQITAYDLSQLYQAREGQIPDYSISPYSFWEFPNWQRAANVSNNCVGLAGNGSFFFDPTTNILYGTFSSNDYGYGDMIVDEWRVNPLGPTPSAPGGVQVN